MNNYKTLYDEVYSLPRAISKLGYTSRTNAIKLIFEGKVFVNNVCITNPSYRVNIKRDIITINKTELMPQNKIYIMLNKPKGLITSLKDEKERDTVFKCFEGVELPYIYPIGRLDKASEGLLLFTNDNDWANKISSNKYNKIYHVKINCLPNKSLLDSLKKGRMCENEFLNCKDVTILRKGKINCWLEIVLNKGKYRHIRRLLKAHNIEIIRLIRVVIGHISLGKLKKGEWRYLSPEEINLN